MSGTQQGKESLSQPVFLWKIEHHAAAATAPRQVMPDVLSAAVNAPTSSGSARIDQPAVTQHERHTTGQGVLAPAGVFMED
jgi:hypothetical protein